MGQARFGGLYIVHKAIAARSDEPATTRAAYDELSRESPEGLPIAPYLEHEGEVVAILLAVGRAE